MEYDEEKYDMTWRRVDNTYQFTHRIPCRVIGTTTKRIRIAALLRNGKERNHLVEVESLVHDPCWCFAECRVIGDLKKSLLVGKA